MLGKPIFRNTRMTVEFVLERLAQGARAEDLVRSHPPLTMEHISAALAGFTKGDPGQATLSGG